MTYEEIKKEFQGITAQGYTTDRNSHKVLDPDLLADIEEIIFSKVLPAFAEKIRDGVVEEVENWVLKNEKEISDAYPFKPKYDYSDFISSSDLLAQLKANSKK